MAVGIPILDSAGLPRKRQRVAAVVYGLVLGILLGAALVFETDKARRAHNPAADWAVIFYFADIFLAVILHEIGHLVAGKIVGFRFSSLTIGPLSLYFEYGRLRFRVRRVLPASGYAGMHVNRVGSLRRRLFIFTAGGPAANLITGAFTLAVLTYSPLGTGWIPVCGGMFWMISFVLGITNLIPVRLGTVYPDGARLRMLVSSLPKSRRWFSICGIGSQSMAGALPRNYRRTWLTSVQAVPDGSVDDFVGNWTSYLAANDRKDATAAEQRLERCLQLVPQLGPSLRDTVALEAAVFSAWFRLDAALSAKWRDRVRKFAALPQLTRSRFEIASDCARGEYAVALSRWQEAYSFIEKLPATPIKTRLSEGFLEWRDEIRDRERAKSAQESTASIASAGAMRD